MLFTIHEPTQLLYDTQLAINLGMCSNVNFNSCTQMAVLRSHHGITYEGM
jgi:hypothetical protein